MKKIEIAICDDEIKHIAFTKVLIEAIMKKTDRPYAISSFVTPESLLSGKKKFDIAILDIEYGNENGIEVAKSLNIYMPKCRIIFLSSYVKYATDVYETEHIWYVLKKDAESNLPKAIDKALRSIESEIKENYIFTKKNNIASRIPVSSVLYITKINRQSVVHCLDKDFYDYKKPDDLVPEELSAQFLRCHQGYIVNLSMIKELDKDEFVLINDERIPISRSFKDISKARFFERYTLN